MPHVDPMRKPSRLIRLCIVYTVCCVNVRPAIATDEDLTDSQCTSDSGAGECLTSEVPQEVSTATVDGQPVMEPSAVEDVVAVPPVQWRGLDLEILQQFAESAISHVEQFMPADMAQQLRGHSLAMLAAVAVLGLLLLVGGMPIFRISTPKHVHIRVSRGVMKALQSCFKERSVLLCGPMDAGKTTLFHALQGHTLPSGTVTSMTASVATFCVPGSTRQLQVVDVPGHPRLQSTFDAKVNAASGVVFMLDSSTFIADKHAVAGHLYDVLRKQAACRGAKKPLLLACNKSDLGERAFSQDFIVRQLEKEMAAFRASHHAALAPGNSKGAAGDGLCDADAKFSLTELKVPVQVCTMSALTGDLSVLPEFLSRL